MAGVEKICVLCGQDCSARPRVKSPDGKYACRACMDKREAQRPAAASLSNDDFGLDAIGHDAGLDMDGLLSDIEVPESNPCPGCGLPRAGGAVVCMNCGLNSQTGQAVATSHSMRTNSSPKTSGTCGACGTRCG